MFDDTTVVLNPYSPYYVALNPTGALVWELVDGTRAVDDTIAAVGTHYLDAPDSVRDGFVTVLTTLSEAGMLGEEITNG